jgi:hypothetical protein
VGDYKYEQRAGMQRVLTMHAGVACIIACALAECHCNVSRLHEVLSGFLSRQTANHRAGVILIAGGVYIEPGRRRCVLARCAGTWGEGAGGSTEIGREEGEATPVERRSPAHGGPLPANTNAN